MILAGLADTFRRIYNILIKSLKNTETGKASQQVDVLCNAIISKVEVNNSISRVANTSKTGYLETTQQPIHANGAFIVDEMNKQHQQNLQQQQQQLQLKQQRQQQQQQQQTQSQSQSQPEPQPQSQPQSQPQQQLNTTVDPVEKRRLMHVSRLTTFTPLTTRFNPAHPAAPNGMSGSAEGSNRSSNESSIIDQKQRNAVEFLMRNSPSDYIDYIMKQENISSIQYEESSDDSCDDVEFSSEDLTIVGTNLSPAPAVNTSELFEKYDRAKKKGAITAVDSINRMNQQMLKYKKQLLVNKNRVTLNVNDDNYIFNSKRLGEGGEDDDVLTEKRPPMPVKSGTPKNNPVVVKRDSKPASTSTTTPKTDSTSATTKTPTSNYTTTSKQVAKTTTTSKPASYERKEKYTSIPNAESNPKEIPPDTLTPKIAPVHLPANEKQKSKASKSHEQIKTNQEKLKSSKLSNSNDIKKDLKNNDIQVITLENNPSEKVSTDKKFTQKIQDRFEKNASKNMKKKKGKDVVLKHLDADLHQLLKYKEKKNKLQEEKIEALAQNTIGTTPPFQYQEEAVPQLVIDKIEKLRKTFKDHPKSEKNTPVKKYKDLTPLEKLTQNMKVINRLINEQKPLTLTSSENHVESIMPIGSMHMQIQQQQQHNIENPQYMQNMMMQNMQQQQQLQQQQQQMMQNQQQQQPVISMSSFSSRNVSDGSQSQILPNNANPYSQRPRY